MPGVQGTRRSPHHPQQRRPSRNPKALGATAILQEGCALELLLPPSEHTAEVAPLNLSDSAPGTARVRARGGTLPTSGHRLCCRRAKTAACPVPSRACDPWPGDCPWPPRARQGWREPRASPGTACVRVVASGGPPHPEALRTKAGITPRRKNSSRPRLK